MGWTLALVALVWALGARTRHGEQVEHSRLPGRGSKLPAVILAAAMLTSHCGLIPRIYVAARESSKSLIGQGGLRSLGEAAKAYSMEHGEYAPSIVALVENLNVTPKQMISPDDPNLPYDWFGEGYSSFVYAPGGGHWRAEPNVVLGYAKGVWSAPEMRLFPNRRRLALFGDGRVELLDEGDFARARRVDAEKRAALGWPACP